MREMELMGAKATEEESRVEMIDSGGGQDHKASDPANGVAEGKSVEEEDDRGSSRADEAPLLQSAANGSAEAAAAPPESAGAAAASKIESLEEMESKYAAYVRDDCYGALGRGALPWGERAKLAAALLTIVPLRFVLLFLVLLIYYAICRIFTLFRSPSDEEGQENYEYLRGFRRWIIASSGRFFARVMLFVLGFYWIKVKESPSSAASLQQGAAQVGPDGYEHIAAEDTPGAIVSNHVSYLDILYHMSASFPSFVAKKSVAKLPLVGLISKCLGCVYVQRESKTSDTKGVSGIVSERLRAAHSDPGAQIMLLFPEGTTTNGQHLLPFKTGAFLSQTPVLPVVLRYPYTRFSPAWESISGVRHILLLLCQPINFLEVTRLPVYSPSDKEKADPKLYASNVRTLMATAEKLTISDIGLQEKRIYLNAIRSKTTA
ncbi:lysophospholipid acyltransferase LPEAT1 [Selaginella moellendorffii]|uniref:lysophospholipid acyltransferase LPEAT1 n=1 Tax=Selaginella moellendorffii TaxID=88036 RepID=UPI000D1D037D|nr:lysophospholipid acyltransferase LPEAT1 [Selaginella moellendorffii]|eukprot:XP_024530643.1 lysophospholipid acyltransferase LPEAT1 [Selaginella moellendorffii]